MGSLVMSARRWRIAALVAVALVVAFGWWQLPALAQTPDPTAVPTATPLPPTVTPEPTATPVSPTGTPAPTVAPTSTPAVTPGATVPAGPPIPFLSTPEPTPTLELDLLYWSPIINLHFSRTSAAVGEPVTLTLSANNSSRLPDMRLLMILQVPSGMSLSGEALEGEDCSGQCSVLFNVPSGAAEEFQLEAVGAEVGVLSLSGIVEWSFPDPQGRAVPEAGMVGVSERLRVNPPATPTPTTGPPEQTTRPSIYISAPRTVLNAGDDVTVSTDLSNPLFSAGAMEGTIRAEVPPGWEAWGSDFAGACSAVCVGNFVVLPGGARTVILNLRPNQVGTYRVQVQADWRVEGGDTDAQGSQESLEFTVLPAQEAMELAESRPDPTALPVQPPSPPAPPAPGGGGCTAPTEPGGPVGLSLPLGMLALAWLAVRRRR